MSKVLCDAKSAMNLMIISPNDPKYSDAITTMLATVEMHIPALLTK